MNFLLKDNEDGIFDSSLGHVEVIKDFLNVSTNIYNLAKINGESLLPPTTNIQYIINGSTGDTTHVVTIDDTTFEQAMNPNTIYVVGSQSSPVTSFTATSLTPSDGAAYYSACIYTAENMSITLPNTVLFGNNVVFPHMFDNYVLIFTIFNNVLQYSYTNLNQSN